MAKRMEVRVPDLGDFRNVEIVEVPVKAGDTVRAEQPLITLETDKAAMEVPAPAAGRLVEMKVQQGGRVSTGDLIAIMEVADAPAAEPASPGQSGPEKPAPEKTSPGKSPAEKSPATKSPPAEKPVPVAAPAPSFSGATLPPIDETGFARAHASPSVRKFARELGVDLAQVKGSGRKGRVVVEDVKAWVKAVLSGQGTPGGGAIPRVRQVDHGKFGPIEVKPLSRVRRLSGPHLHASWLNIPHVTQQDEADITGLEERRKALKFLAEGRGIRLTPLAFIIKACVMAIKEFPDFNSSLTEDGGSLVHKKYWHIGFAADTPQGLVVPVIRDADRKDILTIAEELGTLSEKARTGRITAAEMQGGTFTVSSLGGIGGTFFTPIVNAPEVAILGVGRATLKPVWEKDRFVPRLIAPLSLSYDHRVIDGATGVRFSTRLVSILGDVDLILKGSTD